MEQDFSEQRAQIWFDKNFPAKRSDLNSWDHDLELQKMREKIASFENSFVQKHAEMFFANIESAKKLAVTPFEIWLKHAFQIYTLQFKHAYSPSVIVGDIVIGLLKVFNTKQASDTDQAKSIHQSDHAEKERRSSKAKNVFDGLKNKDEEAILEVIRSEVIETIQSTPELMDWCEKLFESTLCSTWTAYEVLCGDLWEDTVNRSFNAASNVINHDPQTNPVDSKKFDMHLLFKYGLNLENRMGTILKHKFKFTSVEQIDYAFSACFETKRTSKKKLRDVENKRLFTVEQTRHLILHKGGVVDERYQQQISPNLAIGDRLVLSLEELGDAMEEVFKSGCSLIVQTEEWLNSQRSSRKS